MANQQQATPVPAQSKEKTVTVVINNREGVEIGQMPHKGMDQHRRVIPGAAIPFISGLNLIDTETLTELRKNPAFADKFTSLIPDSRAPEQRPEKVGKPILEIGKELPAAAPLSKLSIVEAVALVEEANDDQLEDFKRKETREEVRLAILSRIEKLSVRNDGDEG